MIALPSSVRIYLAAGAVDLRKSIDGLGAIVMERDHDLYSGHLSDRDPTLVRRTYPTLIGTEHATRERLHRRRYCSELAAHIVELGP